MKNECDIVRDLLFSYNDGVLSETSKNFVEDHLKTCESCNDVLKEMKKEEKRNKNFKQEKEIDAFKGVRKKMKKRNLIICISLIILLIIIILNVLVFINYNKQTSTMEIFMQEDITDEQIADIENIIKENSNEVEINYKSSEEHLKEVKEWMGEDGNILSTYQGENNPFRPSLIVKVKDSKDIQKIEEAVENVDGIFKITTCTNQNPYILFLMDILRIN